MQIIITTIAIFLFTIAALNPTMQGSLSLSLGYYTHAPLYTHFTYLICHTNPLHFALNAYALYKIVPNTHRLLNKYNIEHLKYYIHITMLAIAVLATIHSINTLPTVGLSGLLFAYIGLVIVLMHNKYSLISLAMVVACNLLWYFFGNVNILLHTFALIYGAITAFIIYGTNRLERDKKRKRL